MFRLKNILLAAVAALIMLPTTVSTAATIQSIAIPSYFYPGALWTQMEQAYPTVRLAIINPNSGPGSVLDKNYLTQVQQSQAAGLSVLGYVPTSYGTRSATDVKAEIDAYYLWYGIDGIFLDEASTDCSVQPYYADLYNYIKGKDLDATVVLNPGTQTNECYMNSADIIVTFEGTYSTYAKNYSAPMWVSRYPATRFWHLIYATSTIREMERAVSLSKQRQAGWVFVTPDTMPNPWDTLPSNSYWSKELTAVQGGS